MFNLILYVELGRHPVSFDFKARMIGFWRRLINGKPGKISSKLYSNLLSMHIIEIFFILNGSCISKIFLMTVVVYATG